MHCAVIWKNAVDSLTAAHRFYLHASPAPTSGQMAATTSSNDDQDQDPLTPRTFVHRHMDQITNILLDQNPKTTGNFERGCVEESLRQAVCVCYLDLRERVEYWEREGYGGLNAAPPKPPKEDKDKEKKDQNEKDGNGGNGDDDKTKKEKPAEDGSGSSSSSSSDTKDAERGNGGGARRDAGGVAGGARIGAAQAR